MIDKALSNSWIVAAAAQIFEVGARIRRGIADSACSREVAIANPDDSQ